MDASVVTLLLLRIVAGAVLGGAIGVAHLRTLAPGIRWMQQGRVGAAIGLQLARFALLTLALLALARFGGPAMLVPALAALVVVRLVMVRREARGIA